MYGSRAACDSTRSTEARKQKIILPGMTECIQVIETGMVAFRAFDPPTTIPRLRILGTGGNRRDLELIKKSAYQLFNTTDANVSAAAHSPPTQNRWRGVVCSRRLGGSELDVHGLPTSIKGSSCSPSFPQPLRSSHRFSSLQLSNLRPGAIVIFYFPRHYQSSCLPRSFSPPSSSVLSPSMP